MSISTYNGVLLLMKIRRCHHVKVNGELCGSPALRAKCYCYFHNNYRHLGVYGAKQKAVRNPFQDRFPVLEDGNSIQAAVMQVIRLILAQQIDTKEAGLLLYALQIASSNLRSLYLNPLPGHMVVDPLLVAESDIGYKPTRLEQFTADTEEEQKEMDANEQKLQQAQAQADAEWEAETRREFEPSANAQPEAANEEAASSTSPRRPPTPTREQVMKLFDAGAALTQHPGDPEYVRAYKAAWAEAGETTKEASGT